MEFSLTQERKNEILNQSKLQIENELFSQLVYYGIDVDSFDPHTYVEPEDMAIAIQYQSITSLVNRWKKIISQIS